MKALRAELAERFAPATANKWLAAVKGVLKECWDLGLIDGETYQRAAAVKSVKGSRLLRGRALEAGEIRALVQVCREDPRPASGSRDAALLGLLYCGGLRRAEVVSLDLQDYDAAQGRLKIRGKGNKERLVFVSQGARGALSAWLSLRGEDPGPLFFRVNKGGTGHPGADDGPGGAPHPPPSGESGRRQGVQFRTI